MKGIKIKLFCIDSDDEEQLATDINEFLSKCEVEELVDIKFSTGESMTQGEFGKTRKWHTMALVIYKVAVCEKCSCECHCEKSS